MVSCGSSSKDKKIKSDFINKIQGTWTVFKIKNITKEDLLNNKKSPFIKIEDKRVSGNNGCNNYFSSIINIDKKSLTFSPFGETRMMCRDMKISDTFSLLLSKIETYTVTKETLTFINAKGEKVLIFTKG